MQSIDRPCVEEDLLGGVEVRVNGNSKGFVGDRGQDGSRRMWAMREPAGFREVVLQEVERPHGQWAGAR